MGEHDNLWATQGQRWFSIIIYLNTVEHGGATSMPRAGLNYRAVQGSALGFYDTLGQSHNGSMVADLMTLHSGCPVLGQHTVKWVAVKWLHCNAIDPRQLAAVKQADIQYHKDNNLKFRRLA
eukprot:NODE_4379_length_585_cov_198.457090_g3173_i0.p1 GENE.NODE_4379_length_585_cov_198.457090_g3173_i0~~NODE_4379_length_585_cov_198.457090_g3173_i0.p1  ORF type:complete len:133 (-),score=49.53 NODE_4379_length_585_cov_198.457090_g3173_i0:186-551(-)